MSYGDTSECVCRSVWGTVHKALHKQINKQNIHFCTRHCTSRWQRLSLSISLSPCCLARTLLMPGTFLCFGGFSGVLRALCQVLTLALITIIIIRSYNNNHFVPINAAAPALRPVELPHLPPMKSNSIFID